MITQKQFLDILASKYNITITRVTFNRWIGKGYFKPLDFYHIGTQKRPLFKPYQVDRLVEKLKDLKKNKKLRIDL